MCFLDSFLSPEEMHKPENHTRGCVAGKIMIPAWKKNAGEINNRAPNPKVMKVWMVSGALHVSDKTDAGVRAISGCKHRAGQNLPSQGKKHPVIFHQLLLLEGALIPYLRWPH